MKNVFFYYFYYSRESRHASEIDGKTNGLSTKYDGKRMYGN